MIIEVETIGDQLLQLDLRRTVEGTPATAATTFAPAIVPRSASIPAIRPRTTVAPWPVTTATRTLLAPAIFATILTRRPRWPILSRRPLFLLRALLNGPFLNRRRRRSRRFRHSRLSLPFARFYFVVHADS